MSDSQDVSSTESTESQVNQESDVARSQPNLREDWQRGKSLTQSFSLLLSREMYTDVTFRVKDGDSTRYVKAHKIILATRSPVFEAMFHGPLAESTEEIDIPDVEVDRFQLFLQFLYTDTVQLTDETAAGVMYIGQKYQVDSLVEFCSQFLSQIIQLDNVLVILDLALLYQQQPLEDLAFRFIDDHAEEVLQSDAFLNITHSALLAILQGDTFYADELAIYKATMAWAKKTCALKSLETSAENMRSVLGKAFFYIRLPTIPQQHVVEVCQEGFLSYEEQARLFWYINKPEVGIPSSNHVTARKKRFSTCKPTIPEYEEQSKENVEALSTSVLIKCQESVFLKGFKLTNDITPAVHKRNNNFKLAFSGTVSFSHSGDTFEFEINPTKFQMEFIKIGECGILLDGSEKAYKLNLAVICKTCPQVSVPVSLNVLRSQPDVGQSGFGQSGFGKSGFGLSSFKFDTEEPDFTFGKVRSSKEYGVQDGDECDPGPICSFFYEDKYRLVAALQYENVSNRRAQ